MSGSGGDVTRLLAQIRDGHPEAADQLFPLVYDELRRMAGAYMRRERSSHTLQATALVHEAYLRLAGSEPAQSRSHFFVIAAQTIRRVLLDYARQHNAGKRGAGAVKVDLDAELLVSPNSLDDVIAIHDALEKLERVDPRQSQLVELRFFGGLNVEETADAMKISTATVKREWRLAKAWLHREMASVKPG